MFGMSDVQKAHITQTTNDDTKLQIIFETTK